MTSLLACPAWPPNVHACCTSFWSHPVPSDYSAPGTCPSCWHLSKVLSLWPSGSLLGLQMESLPMAPHHLGSCTHPLVSALSTLTSPSKANIWEGRAIMGFCGLSLLLNGSGSFGEVLEGRWSRGRSLWRGLSLSFPPKVLGWLCSPHSSHSLRISPDKVRILLARKSSGRLSTGYTWGLLGAGVPRAS